MELYLEAGKIINTHGVRGEVKIEHWCDSPDVLAELSTVYFKKNGGFVPIKIKSASIFKQFVIAKLDGVDTIEDAQKLKNTVIYADRRDIPLDEGAYLVSDLIGLGVFDADTGERYGTLSAVTDSAASQLYEVDTGHGIALIPVVAEFVKRVDPESGIFIKPIEGLLDL
jgi:16S rRNA processing protein RimM